ncbi:2-oxoacid:ferredoxin oxidoreductase subunit beta [Thermotoga neapolitana]|uniref:2-oxoglutarate ferredoxin oxidoreductase, beta subunit n=1 Tax=Thermotoga neapolitana (strain ATCC 49049 / DSM 4359 / NBRC 107923 / NS-E) TaxID=309803 RepID=B9KBP4_THENN|nr:2-oxoacid:ferredoxin oxidoreductase subunit beta [Thermotoga neapolitana]ACM22440.1 2-oxoglutarate ferredoxin oxidoreductase, beta subunit [Thermotoga neapolitana DSM 4359]KFZ22552.1 2-oxoglutarate ferredoxin oxidoreductase subunit beta [Thermotoga neapolitana LA10]HBF10261.1 2-oxoacid:ferredoxin oxidoreductase subunit beta [Thermotoga neapolitana]
MKTNRLISYLRPGRWPSVWCPGCGNGIVLRAFLEAVDALSLPKEKVAVVSGIGCSSRATGYLDFNTLHTLHGRAIAFATGVKLAKPDFEVVVMGGDGDIVSIGGNHFIHACRRNIDITVIVFNNMIYGMTGGQVSSTTPIYHQTSTTPMGSFVEPLDVVELALSAGATFVARSTVYHYDHLVEILKRALRHRGISVVDVLTNCHTYFGRYNGMPEPYQMMEYFKNNTCFLERPQEGKIKIGVFRDEEKEDFLTVYRRLTRREGAME